MTSLETFGQQFAGELQTLVRRTLGTSRAVRSVGRADRIVVRPGSAKPVPITLSRKGHPAAKLMFSFAIELDSHRTHPAVVNSQIKVTSAVTNRPVIRYEFVKEAYKAPTAHWQIHGESTELGRIMSNAKGIKPELGGLHFPVGGNRFRPCLEDVIEFLIAELGFDHETHWRKAVQQGRAGWRVTQLAAAVRDAPETAAQALRGLGYEVSPEAGAVPVGNDRRLTSW